MQTLKEVKIEMYQNIKDRYNDFLSEEERYIVENLESEDDKSGIIKYTEDQAADICFQCLDGIDSTDTENAFWEDGYIRGYEVALHELKHSLETTDEFESINDVKQTLNYLLTN